MGHTKKFLIELVGGPDDGTAITWIDSYPPSRWLTRIPGHDRLRSLYRPVKTEDGNSYVRRADGTHVYSYEGQEQT